jgi:L-asparagine transporter-like permease
MKNISKERIATFLLACIGIRLSFAFLAYWIEKNEYNNLRILIGIVGLVMSLSFLFIYFFGSESADRQLEVWKDEDKNVWWNKFRIIHGLLYLFFALFALTNTSGSYVFLSVDVTLGLILWLLHHQWSIV